MAVTNVGEEMLLLNRSQRQLPVFKAQMDKQVRRPAVIIIHEIFGLTEHIKDVARRFAKQGMIAYAPDLFAGSPKLPEDRTNIDAMRAVWQSIPDQQIIEDLQAVFAETGKHRDVMADKVGVIGYCMGGAMALMFGCNMPKVAWIADYYGRIVYPELSATKAKHPIDYLSTLPCPFLGLFAGKDELITAEHRAALEQRLLATGKRYEIKVYEGAQHAFFNDSRQHYDAEAAKDAWETTLGFISRAIHLPGAR